MTNDKTYQVIWEKASRDDIKLITKSIALKMEEKINNYLIQSPKELGRQLTGNHSGLYRYRYGDYRILYEIDEENDLIIINRVGHRSAIY